MNPLDRRFPMSRRKRGALAVAALFPALCWAGGVQTLGPVEVLAPGLVGAADSATEGTVTEQQIATRPWLRPGELLETVPGLIVTQHTSDRKANQYFLRGFNLDHGTDFATFVLGMPVNLPTHAHGQGYTDVNFVIPELVSGALPQGPVLGAAGRLRRGRLGEHRVCAHAARCLR
jgi:hypothetical protein